MKEIVIQDKMLLTLKEASEIYSISVKKLRSITNRKDCDYVRYSGKKKLIVKDAFEKYINENVHL